MKKPPEWGMFFDFHTMPKCPGVGENFDTERIAELLRGCGIDFICFPARCNLGMAYYNTKTGIRHPSLKYDLLGRMVESCTRRGIRVSAYINAGLSHQEGLEHRDWLALPPDGATYSGDRVQNNFFRRMCYRTGYAEHLAEMAEEVLRNYAVSGIFFDCFLPSPCIGFECVEEMKKRGCDPTSEEQIRRFAVESRNEAAAALAKRVRAVRPNEELLIYFNGIPFEDQQDLGTYLEYEGLGRSCYEMLPPYAHYARNLGKTVMNMIGRFHKTWGDFGGIRTPDSLSYELGLGLMNTLHGTVGDHFHPRGDIQEPVFDLVREVYARFRKFDGCFGPAKARVDLGVLVNRSVFSNDPAPDEVRSLYGVCQMLDGLHMQYDVITNTRDLTRYRALILPDETEPDETASRDLTEFVRNGGAVLASAHSAQKSDFASMMPLEFLGESPHDPAYFRLKPTVCPSFPDMPVILYTRGTSCTARPDAESLADIIRPVFNLHWDGEQGHFYTPPDAPSGECALARKGKIIQFSHPVFRDFADNAYPCFRTLLGVLLKSLFRPLVETENLPAYARCTLTEQTEKRRIVHLMNYQPTSPAKDLILVEPPAELRNVKIILAPEFSSVQTAYRPDTKEIYPLRPSANGGIEFTIPAFNGYLAVVLEG